MSLAGALISTSTQVGFNVIQLPVCMCILNHPGAVDNHVNYLIDSSNLPRPHRSCILDRATISGGKFVSAGAGIRLGVAQTPVHIGRDTYFDKMNWVAKRYAIFWDEGENRGWLVNGPSALLHLVLASIQSDLNGKLCSNILFNKERLEVPTSHHTTDSALEILTNKSNKELQIHVDKVEIWTEKETTDEGDGPPSVTTKTKTKTTYTHFEDRVERMYCLLEQAMEKQTSVEREDGLDLKIRVRKYLEGWDFRDFATDEDFIYPRVKTLPTMAKGWVDFTREINAITIFGKNFGEIICPADPDSVCGAWARHPSQKHYLAACVSDLKEAPEIVFDGHEAKVGKSVVWHVPDDLFHRCQCTSSTHGKTEHSHVVQVLAPQRSQPYRGPKSTGKIQLDGNAAVIFGYNPKFFLRWNDKGDPVEAEIQEDDLLAPLPREEEFHDSAIGSSSGSVAPGNAQTELIHPETATRTRPDSELASNAGAWTSGTSEADRYVDMTSSSRPVSDPMTKEVGGTKTQPAKPPGRFRWTLGNSHTPPQQISLEASGDGSGTSGSKRSRRRFRGGVKEFFVRNIKRPLEALKKNNADMGE